MIRPFSLPDLDQILQIENKSFPKSSYDRATFIHLHYLYLQTFLVYVDDTDYHGREQIWGYIVFSPNGHIVSIAVHPQHRRQGIGKRLLEEALHFPSMRKVWAEVRESNEGSQAFFLSMGFEIIGRVLNYYGTEDALIVSFEIGVENSPLR